MLECGPGARVGAPMTSAPNGEEGKNTGVGGRQDENGKGEESQAKVMLDPGDVFRAGDPGPLASAFP